jgi:hypothetical protein
MSETNTERSIPAGLEEELKKRVERGISRAMHLEWCKARALEYVDRGDLVNALSSMGSDLTKHPETANHIGTALGLRMIAAGLLGTAEEMRKFINGFN